MSSLSNLYSFINFYSLGLTLFWLWAILLNSYLFINLMRAIRFVQRVESLNAEILLLSAYFAEHSNSWIFYDGRGS